MKQQLRKKLIYDQMKIWIDLMEGKAEWSSVKRHLWRAMVAVSDLIATDRK